MSIRKPPTPLPNAFEELDRVQPPRRALAPTGENGQRAKEQKRQDAKPGWRGHAPGDAGQETNNTFDDSKIRRNHGDPYATGIKGGISINERYFVARFAAERMVLHELNENEFYFYNPANGAWEHRTPAEVREMFAQDWQRIASDCAEERFALATYQPFARKPRFTIARLGGRQRCIQSRRPRHPLCQRYASCRTVRSGVVSFLSQLLLAQCMSICMGPERAMSTLS